MQWDQFLANSLKIQINFILWRTMVQKAKLAKHNTWETFVYTRRQIIPPFYLILFEREPWRAHSIVSLCASSEVLLSIPHLDYSMYLYVKTILKAVYKKRQIPVLKHCVDHVALVWAEEPKFFPSLWWPDRKRHGPL